MRFRYRVDNDRTFSRLYRRKTQQGAVLTLTIPGRWNISADISVDDKEAWKSAIDAGEEENLLNTGNEYSTQFAVEAAHRLQLANESISDDDSFLGVVNTIIFIYLTHYHYMDTFYYGKIDHGQKPDWNDRGETMIRETYGAFEDKLKEAASRLRDIPIENFTGWDEYFEHFHAERGQ